MRTEIFQTSNKNISALKVFIASLGLPEDFFSIMILSPQEAPKSFREAPRKLQKISGQKTLQYFRCYFVKIDVFIDSF